MTAAALAVAAVATAGGITVTRTLDRPHPDLASPPAAAGLATACVLTLPRDPSAVRVRVVPGGASAGVRGATVAGLRERGLTVLADPGSSASEPSGPTTLVYGPATIGAAAFLRATVIGGATMRFDPARSGDVVDLALGTTFTRLATTTEINQALVTAGQPTAPPGC